MGAPQCTLVPPSSWPPTGHQDSPDLWGGGGPPSFPWSAFLISHFGNKERSVLGGRDILMQTPPLVGGLRPPRGQRKSELLERVLKAGLWVCCV